ncbi:DUF3043 domain-containing protein [Corynebacterium epidermidicanis]|uniref:Putative DUF3043 family protein n=1 Tax=Corynebacterium epidermidicanis TaxID=1050174 RepID=A0A0G3GSJ8_9CORY|nr:DUF3043 domain-containing protein [Corynebacterium epidermidicanis]AKK03555.1 putative DUF3043 family protein [Corynebacterium epidermidicanis]
MSDTTNNSGSDFNDERPRAYTPKKGRPTPKRDEVERARGVRRGPVAAPETAKEARARRKAMKESMSKEEYKAYKNKQREERQRRARETQAAMDRGDEKYLLPRDKGEERKFVRDWVDSKRFLNNLVLPVALALLVIMFVGQIYPTVAGTLSMVTMVIILGFLIEGIFIGRGANKRVREKFPHTTDTGFGMGFYAYSRATQLRNLRTPKPRVKVGDQV